MNNKKKYFIISSLAIIITYIYTIFRANKIVDSLLAVMDVYPDGMRERINSLLTNSGQVFIIICSLIGILLNIYILYRAYTDKLLRYKGTIIAFSIISFLLANESITQLIAIINIIMIASSKRINSEDFPTKKEIPNLKKEHVDKKKIMLSIILFVLYFGSSILIGILFNDKMGIIIESIVRMFLIPFSLYVFWDPFKRDFISFKNNFSTYMNYILPRLGIYYLIFIVVNLICMAITKNATSANQTSVEALKLYISIPLAVIFAPIVEELLFRGAIRRFISNDKIFIIVSGIVFGLLHTVFSETSFFNVIVTAIPYGLMGVFFAQLYVKTNNLCSSMFCHFINNAFAMMVSILIVGLI